MGTRTGRGRADVAPLAAAERAVRPAAAGEPRERAARTGSVRITIRIAALRRTLAGALAFLCLAGVAAELVVHVLGIREAYGLIRIFDLSDEGNLPNWYSSALLLACALVLAIHAVKTRGESYHRHWTALAIIFLYMAIDEGVAIHELLNQIGSLHGIFYFTWVIPVGALVVVFGLCYLPFLAHLPPDARWGFVRAGAIYVGGALGVELLLGYWSDLHGTDNLGYGLIDALEESLEILGASLFLCTLVRGLATPEGEVRISIGASDDAAPSDASPVRG